MVAGIISGIITLLGGVAWLVYEIYKRRSSPEYKKKKLEKQRQKYNKYVNKVYSQKDPKKLAIGLSALKRKVDRLRAYSGHSRRSRTPTERGQGRRGASDTS